MSELSRRDFIKQASALSACACCFGAATLLESCSASSGATSTAADKSIVETPGQISIAKTAFANQSYLKFNSGKFKEAIFVNTNTDGTYTAVLLHCTHKGCEVRPSDGKLACPCHGSQFDLDGHVIKGPAKSDLQTFPVTTDDQHVLINVQ